MVNISIHAPAWGATHQLQHQVALLCISIHALAWGATSAGVGRSAQTSYFNPRTRVGCDMVLSCALQSQGFQSTHPRGVRLRFCRNAFLHSRFQSTHPRGVRPFLLRNLFRRFNISIHAPAWGATLPDLPNAYPILHFNPRTRVGCDGLDHRIINCGQLFQSTHPRGVRLFLFRSKSFPDIISIHAPAWGATNQPGKNIRSDLFQSTHPRGVRPSGGFSNISTPKFQSTHPSGVRLKGLNYP